MPARNTTVGPKRTNTAHASPVGSMPSRITHNAAGTAITASLIRPGRATAKPKVASSNATATVEAIAGLMVKIVEIHRRTRAAQVTNSGAPRTQAASRGAVDYRLISPYRNCSGSGGRRHGLPGSLHASSIWAASA